MKNSKYFAEADELANERFMNAYGDGDFEDFVDDNFTGQEMLNATGAAMPQTSEPYIIKVVETGGTNHSSVEVLNSFVTAPTANAQTGLSFSYGLSGWTYSQFLYWLNTNAVSIGLTRLIVSNASDSVVATQLIEPMKIQTNTPNGNGVFKNFVPSIDNYQFSKYQVDIPYDYYLNGATSFIFNTIYANTTIIIRMYPGRATDGISQLNNKPSKGYLRPQINPALQQGIKAIK